jgi:hypothetical protein
MQPVHHHSAQFAFTTEPDVEAIICTRVAAGAPVLYVSHDEDGNWQLLCGGNHAEGGSDGAASACLRCQVARDASLNATAGLGLRQAAHRESADAAWTDEQPDHRWRDLDAAWRCTSCGEEHRGIFDLGSDKPVQWRGSAQEPNSAVVGATNILTPDFCILDGEHFFVRCVLYIPLIGAGGRSFAYGVWSTLSRKNFDLYVDSFDQGGRRGLGPWFGWFSNALHGYPDTVNLKCQIHPRSGRQRPWIELEPTDHPLAVEQRNGIGFERFAEILRLNGHTLSDAHRNGRGGR